MSENAVLIEDLWSKVECIYNETGGVRIEMDDLNRNMRLMNQKLGWSLKLEERLSDVERYGMRWNLRLYGLSENSKEDVKARVKEVCRAVVPTFNTSTVDVAYRLGRINSENQWARPVIIRLISHSEKEILWRAAKTASTWKLASLQSGADLPIKQR